MIYQYPRLAIERAKDFLYNFGNVVEQEHWQSVKSPSPTIELLNHSFGFLIPNTIQELKDEIKPNLPWADDHFKERVGGKPLNPPPSSDWWPFASKRVEVVETGNHKGVTVKAPGRMEFNAEYKKGGMFSHTYPERFWPKYVSSDGIAVPTFIRDGIRFKYGDYQDVVNLLIRDPSTRQAYLPIWFPEDTGAVHGERVPCSLGYHFIIRNQKLHIVYYIRSCDIIRHFRDDIYMACLLVFDVIEKIDEKLPELIEGVSKLLLEPGTFTMHITSLHCFVNEKELLKTSKI